VIVRVRAAAFALLRRLFLAGLARGLEVHAYALGRRTEDGVVVTDFVATPVADASSVFVAPDYGAAALQCAPYFARGLVLLGEVHSHVAGPVGPSGGDVQTLRAIAPAFPGYLCMVITSEVLTAHAIQHENLLAHDVIIEEYALLARQDITDKKLLIVGAGSGIAAAALPLLKLGFGTITIADADLLEARNLERHFADNRLIGRSKVAAFQRFAHGRTTATVRALPLALNAQTSETFRHEIHRHDIVLTRQSRNQRGFHRPRVRPSGRGR
jgi:hypothetical protein